MMWFVRVTCRLFVSRAFSLFSPPSVWFVECVPALCAVECVAALSSLVPRASIDT
jgi:hypothetical protein